jgi:hypothetical protein
MDGLNLFAHFIAELALNPELLGRYQREPEAVMEDVGLNDGEKGLLRKGDFKLICEYLLPTRGRPAPEIEPVGPPSH